jgi:cholesterol transport system auxiliary component
MMRAGLFVLLLALAGCGGGILAPSGPSPALYTLHAPPRIDSPGPRAAWQLLVDLPAAPLALDSTRIAIAPASDRIDYYADVAWADRAPALLQALIVESFEHSGRIAAVQRQGGGLHADLVLTLNLEDFQADAAASTVKVRFAAKLVRMKDRQIVAIREFATESAVGAGGFDGVIAAFDQAVGGLLPDLVGWTLAEGDKDR